MINYQLKSAVSGSCHAAGDDVGGGGRRDQVRKHLHPPVLIFAKINKNINKKIHIGFQVR